ncbi:hypothetical protein [Dictyobacter halimunensis]
MNAEAADVRFKDDIHSIHLLKAGQHTCRKIRVSTQEREEDKRLPRKCMGNRSREKLLSPGTWCKSLAGNRETMRPAFSA